VLDNEMTKPRSIKEFKDLVDDLIHLTTRARDESTQGYTEEQMEVAALICNVYEAVFNQAFASNASSGSINYLIFFHAEPMRNKCIASAELNLLDAPEVETWLADEGFSPVRLLDPLERSIHGYPKLTIVDLNDPTVFIARGYEYRGLKDGAADRSAEAPQAACCGQTG